MLPIEKNIPVPNRAPRGYYSNTLRNMELGDSVLLPSEWAFNFKCVAYQKGYKTRSERLDGGQHRVWVINKPGSE